MKRYRIEYPSEYGLLSALSLAVFSYFAMISIADLREGQCDLIFRHTVYIAAVYLLYFDVFEAANIARVRTMNVRSQAFWAYGFHLGFFLFIYFWLLRLGSIESDRASLGQIGFISLVTGFSAVFLTNGRMDWASRFDLEKPINGAWHFVLLIFLSLMISYFIAVPPTTDLKAYWVITQIAMWGSLSQFYPFRSKNFWRKTYPKFLGIVLLLIGYLAF